MKVISRKKSLLWAFALVFVVSCGSPKSSTSSIPQAPTPSVQPQQTITVPTPPTVDSRLPDLSTAASINLTDFTNLSGLMDLAGNVFAPLVGDPKIVMHVPSDRNQNLYAGDVLVSFEDKQGFWAAQQSIFAKNAASNYDSTKKTLTNAYQFTTSTIAGSLLDMTFGDSSLVMRVTGTVNATGDLNGTVYYRIPQAGETACHQITINCVQNPAYIQQYIPYPPYTNPNYHDDATNPLGICNIASDTASKCFQYMNTANLAVKKLGTFVKTDYRTSWATLSEGQ